MEDATLVPEVFLEIFFAKEGASHEEKGEEKFQEKPLTPG